MRDYRTIPRTCKNCGAEFLAVPAEVRRGGGHFCSRTCSARFTGAQRQADLVDRFWSKVDRSGGPDACWVWLAGTGIGGYGRFSVGKGEVLAHRFAWELANGPIPEDLCVCHNCPGGDNPSCVNASHMFLGTRADNRADCVAKGRQAQGCRHGTHTKPESVTRGESHWKRLRPEDVPRGDDHWTRHRPDRIARAEENGNARVTWAIVHAIRAEWATGGVSQQSLADQFGISQTAVSSIVRNKTWQE